MTDNNSPIVTELIKKIDPYFTTPAADQYADKKMDVNTTVALKKSIRDVHVQ